MATGTRIERLYLSLGLDISEFDRDLAGAQQHVRQAATQLNRNLRLQRLRMEIDIAGIDNADQSVRGLGVRLGHLQSQLQTQRNSVQLLNHAHQESVRQLGANAAASRNLEERLTRERLAEARLAQQVRQTNQARRERIVNNVSEGVQGTAMALAPVVGMGAASLKLAVDAVESENLWRESMGKMKEQGDEWSKGLRDSLGLNEFELRKSTGMLNTMFESMGMGTETSYNLATKLNELSYDMASFYNLPTDQAFEKLRAGMTGEMEPLKALGILVDEETVKNYAYANSITEQGAQLTSQQKVLARYGTIMEQTKRSQGDMARTINDPANAIRVLESNVEQLGIEFGQTLIPTLQEFVKAGKDITDWYKNADEGNKSVANSFAKATIEIGAATIALAGFSMVARMVNPWVALATAVVIATSALSDHLKKQKELKELKESQSLGQTPDANNAKVRTNSDTGYMEKEVIGEGIFGEQIKRWQKVEGEELARLESQAGRANFANMKGDNPAPDLDQLKKEQESNRQRDVDNAKRQEAIEKQAAATRLKINQDLSDDIYKLTHTDMENAIHDIDQKVAELRKGKAEEINIIAWAEAAKAKVVEDSNKELNSAIYNISHSALQNRLRDIETERQAWIKKTGDDVKATQLAEQEKSKAIKDAINSQYGEEVRAVSAAIKAGTSISDAYREAHEKVIAEQKADSEAYSYVKNKLGVYEPGDIKKTVVIENNSAYNLSEVVKELSFNIAKFDPNIPKTGSSNATNNITVNVPVTATINNDADVTALANKVADVMQPQLINALNGGGDNGY